MSLRTSSQDLLKMCETVAPGLSTREIVEQSNCLVFKDRQIMTYNDEVSCRAPSHLKIEGAIPAAKFMELLQKMGEGELTVKSMDGELLVRQGTKRAGLRLESEVHLPVDMVDVPGEWKPLHRDFLEAISLVQECASSDESIFKLTCIHIHPKFLEASDNFQIIHYKIKTGVSTPTLVKRDAIKHVTQLGVTEFSETESWLHFRNPQSEVQISCRRYVEEYPDTSPYFDFTGETMSLPKGLEDATKLASVFSSETKEKLVRVTIRGNKARVKGQGESGWFSESKTLTTTVERDFSFDIPPNLLIEIIKRYNDLEVSDDRLKVNGLRFTYVACLGRDVEAETNGDTEENGDE